MSGPASAPAHLAARWLLPAIGDAEAASLAQSLGLTLPAARVLLHRGYTTEAAARAFLDPQLADLHSPSLLKGVDEATARLQQAIQNNEPILLYGDYDVDGTMSVALLTKAIERCGGRPDFHVPHRLKEGYGMRPEVIDQAAARGIKLIVSVDTGIRANAVVQHAATLGIDVIVTDHHLPEAAIPPAAAVINPNQPGCPYPNKNLCGAGVAYKLGLALLQRMDVAPASQRKLADSLLKLVAIATVADVVPLTGENRVIVRHGLAGLERTPNPGLQALLSVAGFTPGQAPTARQVGFQIGPRINAAGRMAHAGDIIELLLKADPARAQAIAAELDRLNRERQETEAAMVAAILEQVAATPVTNEQAALVFSGDGWHKGVVGIVASRVVDRFHRPAFVLAVDPATGLAQGSGRSVPLFHLLEALESMPDLFTKFGGHKQAAGLTLEAHRLDEFRQRFNAWAATKLTPEDFRPQVTIDALASLEEFDDRSVSDVWRLAPFGNENDAPVFAIRNLTIPADPEVKKDKHVFFFVQPPAGGRAIKVKAWNFAERLPELYRGARVDVALRFEEDHFTGGWSTTLKDVRPASPE